MHGHQQKLLLWVQKELLKYLEGSNMSEIEDPEERARIYCIKKKMNTTKNLLIHIRLQNMGYIDDVIEPRNTRFRIIRGLELLANKKEANPPKKHSNIPL